MTEIKISAKNQIVVPREAREALGVKAGDKLLAVVYGTRLLVLQKPISHSEAIHGIGADVYPPDYLRKERDSWD
jgi:AbrB family looped-hinge helix DNA binding protein